MGLRLRRNRVPEPVSLHELGPEEQALARHAAGLRDILLETMATTFKAYVDLDPDGRVLSRDEAAVARARLEAGATCGRLLDRESVLVTTLAEGDLDLRPSLVVLRTMQRSLLLALSDDPDRRARAVRVSELQSRMRPIYAWWLELPAP